MARDYAGDTGAGQGCTRFCECPPDFVQVDINSPERRQYHMFEPIPDEHRAILFGGKGDCGYLDDTWSFSFEDDQWLRLSQLTGRGMYADWTRGLYRPLLLIACDMALNSPKSLCLGSGRIAVVLFNLILKPSPNESSTIEPIA